MHLYQIVGSDVNPPFETLSLVDMEPGRGIHKDGDSVLSVYSGYSSRVFRLLANLGSGNPRNRDLSSPWISTAGLKSLSVFWIESDPYAVTAFLRGAPIIEEICPTNVGQTALGGIVAFAGAHVKPATPLPLRNPFFGFPDSSQHSRQTFDPKGWVTEGTTIASYG